MSLGLLRFISINHLTLIACVAAGAGFCLFLRGFQLFVRKHSLGHIPASTIRAASAGPATISGVTSSPFTLSAPITGKRCYLCQTTVWQRSKPAGKRKWEKVIEETLHLPFFVEDATGHMLVEPRGAELNLRHDFRKEFGLPSTCLQPENIPPRVGVFLARHGITPNRPTRIEERSIQPDEPVFITGTLTENPGIQVRPFTPGNGDSQLGSADRATKENAAEPAMCPEIIRLSSGPAPSSTMHMTQQGKIAAALNRAGITNPESWAANGVRAQSVPAESVAVEDRAQPPTGDARGTPATAATDSTSDPAKLDAGSGPKLAPPLVLMKDTNSADALFAIRHNQPDLATSLGWRSVAMVVAGTGLTLLGLCVLLLEWQLR